MRTKSVSIYQIGINALQGGRLDLQAFKGKKMLLVNTASECGHTPQYKQLQELHETFGNRLAVIGIPSNDFGGQEPGTAEQIEQFCQSRYGVTFPLTEKMKILEPDRHPLYNFLTRKELNGFTGSEVKWNFQKYLLDEKGDLIGVFKHTTDPLSEEILSLLDQ